jgi:periplasmic divalent cation tolerance protein
MTKASTKYVIVLVTAPDLKVARQLARSALQDRLIACANLVPRIESYYRWRGKVESSREVLMVLKTKLQRLGALEKLILAKHPYDTPEFLVLPVKTGSARYLQWIADSVSTIGL